MTTKADLPIESFASAEAFREWLAAAHADSPGVWLKIAKKSTGVPSVSYSEAIDVALCFGWIDGQKGRFDDDFWLQRFTPRKARSRWSKINCDRAEALIAAGAMHPAGHGEVERAKADGRWDAAYAGQRTATVPDDLAAALEANPAAKEFFATLDSANRYAVLYRIGDTQNPTTRARRIEKYVTMLTEGKKVHP